MLGFFGPAQLGDVDETFDALFEFDEDAVVDDADDFAFNFAARGIFFGGIHPGRA